MDELNKEKQSPNTPFSMPTEDRWYVHQVESGWCNFTKVVFFRVHLPYLRGSSSTSQFNVKTLRNSIPNQRFPSFTGCPDRKVHLEWYTALTGSEGLEWMGPSTNGGSMNFIVAILGVFIKLEVFNLLNHNLFNTCNSKNYINVQLFAGGWDKSRCRTFWGSLQPLVVKQLGRW